MTKHKLTFLIALALAMMLPGVYLILAKLSEHSKHGPTTCESEGLGRTVATVIDKPNGYIVFHCKL